MTPVLPEQCRRASSILSVSLYLKWSPEVFKAVLGGPWAAWSAIRYGGGGPVCGGGVGWRFMVLEVPPNPTIL